MQIKLYHATEEEAHAELEAAQAGSFCKTGSHDDSRLTVVVNGQELGVGEQTYQWTSVQNSSYDHDKQEPEKAFVDFEDVWNFSILDTFAHYGSSQRSRATLKIYYRSINSPQHFVVLDVGKVGWRDAGHAPFATHDLFEVLLSANKKTRVEVTGEAETWQQILGFWNGNYGRRFFSDSRLNLQPQAELDFYSVVKKYFGDFVDGETGPAFSMDAFRRMVIEAFVGWAKMTGSLHETIGKVAANRDWDRYDIKMPEMYATIWPHSLAGHLVKFFSATPNLEKIRWHNGRWEIQEYVSKKGMCWVVI